MTIIEKDFTMTTVSNSSNLFNLCFNKKVKKKDTGKFEIEPGDTLYGLPLSSCLLRIAHHRTAKKYEEDNITLFEYLRSLQEEYKNIVKLCKESLPENFDTGD